MNFVNPARNESAEKMTLWKAQQTKVLMKKGQV